MLMHFTPNRVMIILASQQGVLQRPIVAPLARAQLVLLRVALSLLLLIVLSKKLVGRYN